MRILVYGAAFILLAYVGLALLLMVLQRNYMFPAPKGPGAEVPGFELVTYPTRDGLELAAGYRAAAADLPTILFFHGNAADWQSAAQATASLAGRGYGVLAAEYRGYRENPGNPSEKGLYLDAHAAADFLLEQGVGSERIVIVGNSIGSGPAVDLAKDIEPHALVLVSPFTSTSDVAAASMPWFPVRLMMRDRFENLAKLPEIERPILLLHGTDDRVIPDSHSRALAAAQPGATLKLFDQIGHDLAYRDDASAAIVAFLEELDQPPPNPSRLPAQRDMRP